MPSQSQLVANVRQAGNALFMHLAKTRKISNEQIRAVLDGKAYPTVSTAYQMPAKNHSGEMPVITRCRIVLTNRQNGRETLIFDDLIEIVE